MENLINFIRRLPKPYRGQCPSCGHKNTFIVNANNGSLFWYCFHASCNLKGKTNYEVSVDELRAVSSDTPHSISYGCGQGLLQYTPPEFFISPLQNSSCYQFLYRSNLIDFYSRNVDLIRYDPKQHRCVFILKDKEGIRGAVGRNLGVLGNSKWYVYARYSGCPFLLQRSSLDFNKANTVLLVEDCVSACTASSVVNCASLCSTNCPPDTIAYLVQYDRLVIALDDDATGKAIKLQKQLSPYRPTFIIPLRKDIKFYSIYELEILKKEIECLK